MCYQHKKNNNIRAILTQDGLNFLAIFFLQAQQYFFLDENLQVVGWGGGGFR